MVPVDQTWEDQEVPVKVLLDLERDHQLDRWSVGLQVRLAASEAAKRRLRTFFRLFCLISDAAAQDSATLLRKLFIYYY